jgi:hypothetical protein
MLFDDVEVNPDGSFAFDAIEFYEDGRSILSWFSKDLKSQKLVAAPKKKTVVKLVLGEAATPPRKPREVEPPPPTPLKLCDSTHTKPMKPSKLFEESTQPLSLYIRTGGVRSYVRVIEKC